jgi:hypothetical protein
MEKLRIEELHSLNSLTGIIRMMKLRKMWTEHVACVGAIGNTYRILIGRLQGKSHVEPRHRLENRMTLKLVLKKESTDRIQLVEDEVQWFAVVDTVINLPVS